MARRNRKRRPVIQRRQEIRAASRRLLKLAGCLLLGLLLGGGAYWAWRFLHSSPALALRQIMVRGNLHTSLPTVLEAANLRQGLNVFAVDPLRSASRLEKLPWVRRARVERQVPDTVLVEIEEWQAAVLVEAGGLYVADPEGEIFKRAAPSDGLDLPVVTGITAEQIKTDAPRARRRLQQALVVLERLRRLPCLQERQIAELHLDELLGSSVVIDPGALLLELDRAAVEQPSLVCQALDRAGSLPSRHLSLGHTPRGWQLVVHRRSAPSQEKEKQENLF